MPFVLEELSLTMGPHLARLVRQARIAAHGPRNVTFARQGHIPLSELPRVYNALQVTVQ